MQTRLCEFVGRSVLLLLMLLLLLELGRMQSAHYALDSVFAPQLSAINHVD